MCTLLSVPDAQFDVLAAMCVCVSLQASDQYLLEGLKRLCEAALAEVSSQ